MSSEGESEGGPSPLCPGKENPVEAAFQPKTTTGFPVQELCHSAATVVAPAIQEKTLTLAAPYFREKRIENPEYRPGGKAAERWCMSEAYFTSAGGRLSSVTVLNWQK